MKKIIGIFTLILSINSLAKNSTTILDKIVCTNEVLSTVSSIGLPVAWKKVDKYTVSSKIESGGKVTLLSKLGAKP